MSNPTTTATTATNANVKTAEQLRDEYRRDLVGTKLKATSKEVMFHGKKLEIRQPPLDDILGKSFEGNQKQQLVNFIINFAYIPGTDLRVFEDADGPQILKWPFGPDFLGLQEAINDVTGIDIEAAEEELSDPLGES